MSQTGWRKWRLAGFGFVARSLPALRRGHRNHRRGHRVPRARTRERGEGPRADQHGEGAGPDNRRVDRANRRCDSRVQRNGPMAHQSTKITLDFKADPPTVTVYLGKPTGGEDKKLVFDSRPGEFLARSDMRTSPSSRGFTAGKHSATGARPRHRLGDGAGRAHRDRTRDLPRDAKAGTHRAWTSVLVQCTRR